MVSWDQLESFQKNQDEIRKIATKTAIREISRYIAEQNRILHHLAEEHAGILHQAETNPDDSKVRSRIWEYVIEYFPNAITYTITDDQGRPLVERIPGVIGKACRSDLIQYAKNSTNNGYFLHANRSADRYHMDILSKIPGTKGNKNGIIMISISAIPLKTILSALEPAHHKLFIARKTGQGFLFEIDKNRHRGEVSAAERQALDKEISSISLTPIPGTDWWVGVTSSDKFLANAKNQIISDALEISATLFITGAIFLVFIIKSEKKREKAERALVEHNALLEQHVQERTRSLAEKQKTLKYIAEHDQLTGLYNRRYFELSIKKTLHECSKKNCQCSLLYMDIDHFKVINDTMGHTAGDRYLSELSSILQRNVRQDDVLARLGGDEFGLVLKNCDLDCAIDVAEKLKNIISSFVFEHGGHQFQTTASMGIIKIDNESTTMETIMSMVDAACYVAKNRGRGKIQIHDEHDTELKTHKRKLQYARISKEKLTGKSLDIYGQKIIDLSTESGSAAWFEVLARVIDQDGNIHPPAEFIEALETYGDIRILDKEMISRSFDLLSHHKDIMLNINLSGKSMSDPDFHKFILECGAKYNITPNRVVFELTETSILRDYDRIRIFMDILGDEGYRFALDDFGSGMSSFSALETLRLDFIKLDGAYVKNIISDNTHRAIVDAINRISEAMGCQTIAEFVETMETAEILKHMGIHYAQGWAYHRPERLQDTLSENRPT